MSYDDWDAILDAVRATGSEHGITVAGWQDVPEGDAKQLFREAAEAYASSALVAFRTRQPAVCERCGGPLRAGEGDGNVCGPYTAGTPDCPDGGWSMWASRGGDGDPIPATALCGKHEGQRDSTALAMRAAVSADNWDGGPRREAGGVPDLACIVCGYTQGG